MLSHCCHCVLRRGLVLGKPELPVGDTHVHFPVQIVQSLIEQFEDLGYLKVIPKDGLGYRRNSDPTREDNPYIIVQAFERAQIHENRPALPQTPRVAKACEQGMFDASFGQSISFPSTFKISFRIEVPVWCDVAAARCPPEPPSQAQAQASNSHDTGTGITGTAEPVPVLAEPVAPVEDSALPLLEEQPLGAELPPTEETDDTEVTDETYLVPEGNGRFLFRRGLLKKNSAYFCGTQCGKQI